MNYLDGYNKGAKVIHWLMAIIILSLIAAGFYMADLPKEDPLRSTLYMLHKSFGMLILILLVVRIFWRLTHKPPSLARYSAIIQKAAGTSHVFLYFLMFAMPASGYLMSTFYGYPPSFFRAFTFPAIVEVDKAMAELFTSAHEYIAYGLITLLAIHIAGALMNKFKH